MSPSKALQTASFLLTLSLVASQITPLPNPIPGDCTPWRVWKEEYFFGESSPFPSGTPVFPTRASDASGFRPTLNFDQVILENPETPSPNNVPLGSQDNFVALYTTYYISATNGNIVIRARYKDEIVIYADSSIVLAHQVTNLGAGLQNTVNSQSIAVTAGVPVLIRVLAYHKIDDFSLIVDFRVSQFAPFNPLLGHLPRASCPACDVDVTSSQKTCQKTGMVGLTGDTVTANTNLALSGCGGVTPGTLTFPDASFTTKQEVTFADLSACSLSFTLNDQCLGNQWGSFSAKTGNIPFTAATGCEGPPPPPPMNLTSASQNASTECSRRVILNGVGFPVGSTSFKCDFNIGQNTSATFTSLTSGYCDIPKAFSSSPLNTRLTLFNGTLSFNTMFLSSPNCCDELCNATTTCTNNGPFAFTCSCTNGGQLPLCKFCQDEYRVEIKTSSRTGSGTNGAISAIFIGSEGRSGSHDLKTGFNDNESHTLSIILNSCIGRLLAIQLDNTVGSANTWRVETINVFNIKGGANTQIGWFGLNEIIGFRRILENPFPIVATTKNTPQANATEKVYFSCEDSMGRLGATNSPGSLPQGQSFTFRLFYFNIQDIVKCTLWTPSLDDWIFNEFVVNRRGVNYFFDNPLSKPIVRSTGFTVFFPYKRETSLDLPALTLPA